MMIETYDSPTALALAAADAVINGLAAGLRERGRASLVATGGRSPGPIYDLLQESLIDWGKVTVTLSDERFVGPHAAESNERLVRERLLAGRAAAAAFAPLYSEARSSEAAAEAAEAAVAALVPFDVLMLGMGEDGHVASLIPGSPVLEAAMDPAGTRLVMGLPPGVGSPPLARMTLTLPALLQARSTIITISGAAKREVVAAGAGLPVHAFLEQATAPVRILWTP
jgi:6-phosphogluconolactonase